MANTTSRTNNTVLIGTILMLSAGALWGTGDIFTKSVYLAGVNLPFNFAIVRLLISLGIYFVLIARSHLISSLRLSLRQMTKPLAYGAMVAAFTGFFLTSLTRTSVADATLLINTSPIFVAIIGKLWLSEKFTRGKIIGIALSLVGASFVIGLPSGAQIFNSTNFQGNLLALLASIATAGVFIVGKIQSSGTDERIVVFYGFVFASILLFPITVAIEGFNPIGLAPALPFVLGSALFSSVAYLVSLISLKRIEATKASVYALMEPIVASILAWLLLGEGADFYTVVGGILIISAVVTLYYKSDAEPQVRTANIPKR